MAKTVTRRLLVVLLAVSGCLVVAPPARADTSFDLGGRRLVGVQDIITTIGSEDAAIALIGKVLTSRFSEPDHPLVVELVSAQVRLDWLPAVPDVHFVLLSDDEARAAYATCDGCWFFSRVEGKNGAVTIEIAQGNRCELNAEAFDFTSAPDGWRQKLSTGMTSSTSSHCRCDGKAEAPQGKD